MKIIRAALAAVLLAAVCLTVDVAVDAPAAEADHAGCQGGAWNGENYWIAHEGTAGFTAEKMLAEANGLLVKYAAGRSASEVFQRANLLAVGTCDHVVKIAPGNYGMSWRQSGRSDSYGPITTTWWAHGGSSEANRVAFDAPYGYVSLNAPIRPPDSVQSFKDVTNPDGTVTRTYCGFNNRFIMVPGNHTQTPNHYLTLRGFGINGYSNSQVQWTANIGGSANEQRWQMDGIREHGASGFRAENLRLLNVRGTTGGGGCGETTSLTLMQGDADNITVLNTDGGNQATGIAQMFFTGSVASNITIDGGGRMSHGMAQWFSQGAIRYGVNVKNVYSSGVRSEESTNSHDIGITVTNARHGWVTAWSTGHYVQQLDAQGTDAGMFFNSGTGWTITDDSRAFANNVCDVHLYIDDDPPPGDGPDGPPTGTFVAGEFTYGGPTQRCASGFPVNWASYGL